MNKTNLPRWMTQGTPSIGTAAANNLRVVSPDELEMTSKMYGTMSQQSFAIATSIANRMAYIQPDYDAMLSNEAMATAEKALRETMISPDIAKDGPTYRKNADGIIKEATKDMGFFSSKTASNMLAKRAIGFAQQIDAKNLQMAEASIMKSQAIEQEKFLMEANSNYPWNAVPEEQQKYVEESTKKYVEFLPNVPDSMKNIYADKIQKSLKTASVANAYISLGSRMDLASVKETENLFSKHEEYFKQHANNPEEMERFRETLSNGMKVKLSQDNFKELVVEARSKSVIEDVRTEISSEPDPVKKRDLWAKAMKENKGYDTFNNMRSLGVEFGFTNGEAGATALSKSQTTDALFRKGMNGELSLEQAGEMVKQGQINRGQYNAYMDGYKKRSKSYDAYDKEFYASTKLAIGVGLEPAKGKDAALAEQFMLLPSDLQLKKDIMERKATLVGLPDVEYKKELEKLTQYAIQKKKENSLKAQEVYKGKTQTQTLLDRYAK